MKFLCKDFLLPRYKYRATTFYEGDWFKDKKYREFRIKEIRKRSIILVRSTGSSVATDFNGFRNMRPFKLKK